MEKRIELIPLAEIGHGSARITENSVEIEINGISGGMKAWLIGGEAVPIGNIVDGKLRKSINTKDHIGVLITQSGRQMLIGKFLDEEDMVEEVKETVPFKVGNFNWRKITEKSFSEASRELRFILSNKTIYENYKKHGHYWIGEDNERGALALKCDESEADPLEFLGQIKVRKNGYVIVCVDKEKNKLYIPDSI